MAEPPGEGALDFDVRPLNKHSESAKRSKRAILLAGAAINVGLGLFLVLDWLGPILNGSLTSLRAVTLLVVLGVVGLVLSAIVPGITLTRQGADRIRVDSTGLEFYHASGKIRRLSWRDAKLSLELADFSRIPQQNVLTDTPWAVRFRGIETALSREAFEAILTGAERHKLIVTRSRGSLWVYPSSLAPVVYRVRAATWPPSIAR
jgi:type II secretory pathway pseudopilin PulG